MHRIESSQRDIDLTKGYDVEFSDLGNRIQIHANCITGKEKITINGTRVFQGRSLETFSERFFSFQDQPYCIRFKAQNLIKGPFSFTLLRGDKTIATKHIAFFPKDKIDSAQKSLPQRLVPFLIFGIIAGTTSYVLTQKVSLSIFDKLY